MNTNTGNDESNVRMDIELGPTPGIVTLIFNAS